MCGICGIVSTDRLRPVNELGLRAMRDTLAHRGPDDAGLYLGQGVGLGSRRLSILDLSPRGHMPMSSHDGRYWITYNGEVYNFRSLRSELADKGHVFHSDTDTEVVLALYARFGPSMLSRLNGMFAFAIWDAATETLFAARDRLGVKPLYYHCSRDSLAFASEHKALIAAGVQATFDPQTWEELLCFRFVAGERTPFTGINRLLPGHSLVFSRGDLKITKWWPFADIVRERRAALPRDPIRWFRETFDDAVDIRRISDVPVGVLLSGGLDSGSVAASLAAAAGRDVASFTVRFDEPGFDEGPLAALVAKQWGLQQHELTLSADMLVDRFEHACWLNDEPLAHASDVHLGAIAEHAERTVTVLLSGEGADELLGGYIRYLPLRFPTLLRLARPLLSRQPALARRWPRTDKLRRLLSVGRVRDVGLFNACDVLPDDLAQLGMRPSAEFPYREQVWNDAEALYPRELMRQAMFSDQHTFLCSLLDRNDRMTMGASVECRVPFLDYRLVEGVAALPSAVLLAGRERKHLLRQAVGARLPPTVLSQRKWGFGVPWSRYLRVAPALRALVERLPRKEPIASGPFERAAVSNVVRRFLAGDPSTNALVQQLVMVSTWHDACVTRRPSVSGFPVRPVVDVRPGPQASAALRARR